MWGAAPILAASSPTLTSAQVIEIWVTAAVSGVLAYAFAVYSRRVTGSYPWRVPAIIWGIFGVLIPVFSLLLEAIARLTTRPVTPPGASTYIGSGAADPRMSGGAQQGPPPEWQPSQPGSWQPPASWQPPQWPPVQPPGRPPTAQWQPPGPPQASDEMPESTAGDATAPEVPGTAWTPGSPGAPAAPNWPPPLGPDAFVQPPVQGHPGHWQGNPQAPPSPEPPWQGAPGPTRPSVPQAAAEGPNGWNQPPPYVPAPTPPPLFGWYPDPTGRHEQRYWDGRHWSHRVSDNGVRSDDPLYPVQDPASAPSGSSLAVADSASGPLVAPDAAELPATADERSDFRAEAAESEPDRQQD